MYFSIFQYFRIVRIFGDPLYSNNSVATVKKNKKGTYKIYVKIDFFFSFFLCILKRLGLQIRIRGKSCISVYSSILTNISLAVMPSALTLKIHQ